MFVFKYGRRTNMGLTINRKFQVFIYIYLRSKVLGAARGYLKGMINPKKSKKFDLS